ncbi:MAG: xanthine dehydrogenase small subunit [Hyphomicrobiaceae bacterium]
MNDQLTFILNGAREDVTDADPTMTLLSYLRRTKRLTGTKEGCAEGDCGACTVAVGELVGGTVQYRPVNACIQFLPMLHGKSVLTVEGLVGPADELHPCQQAIVECHGSQCGFCTPGFVMSLYALSKGEKAVTKDQINDALAGNLCRCTGYGPLIAAAEVATQCQPRDWEAQREATEKQMLTTLAPCNAISGSGKRSYRPSTLDELARLYEQNPDAVIIAGATDVGLWVTKQMRALPITIHISQIEELRAVRVDGDKLWIGAAATYAEAERAIVDAFPDFGELIRRIGGVQVRSAGTIGGNVANGSPIGDTPPALIALGAEVILRKGGARRRLPLEAFFVAYGEQDRGPGEFVEGIEVPLLDDPEELRCYKVSKRFDQDISALCGCFSIKVRGGVVAGVRIAFGGMAATPLRARTVESRLLGQPWTLATIDNAVPAFEQDFAPISDMRASADYRLLTAKNLLRKYFAETQQPASETRLVGPQMALS